MRRRLLTPILTLMVLLAALPAALIAAQTPVARDPAEPAEVRTIETGEDTYVALSPDGAHIAGVGAEGGLCVWQTGDAAGACAEEVGAIRAESIVWSPDGTAVAFSLDHVLRLVESDIFVYELADGTLHNLTDDGADGPAVNTDPGVFVDGVPAWSPDSQALAFARSEPADETFGTVIMRIDRAGGEPSRIHRLPLETPYGIFMPMHWLPDDSLLYTQVSLDGTDPGDGVWRVGLDGSDARHLLPGARGTDIPGPLLMDVSPEAGLALVYAFLFEPASQFEVPDEPQVWLMDIETGEATAVPNLPPPDGEDALAAGRAQAATFSPDGSAFAVIYSSTMMGTVVAVTEVATGAVTVVASDVPARVRPTLPTWAGDRLLLPEPDQATFVTIAAPQGAVSPPASPVASPAATGGTAWRVADTRALDSDARYPVLSPDGTQLAGVDGEGHLCLWVTETLVSACIEERLPIREETITWSPDGTAVAFALDAVRLGYESDLYLYEVVSGELVNLTDDGVEGGLLDSVTAGAPSDDVPVWSPDSQEIAFVRSYSGDDAPFRTAIMRIDRDGGEPAEAVRPAVDQPWSIWMPMRWLPDGTLLYAQSSSEVSDERNGIWKATLDGDASPIQIAPGAAESDIPGATVVDAAGGRAIVFAWMRAGQFGFDGDEPVFWLVDIDSGERVPFPDLPEVDGTAAVPIEAVFAPDGGSILIAAFAGDGLALMTLDPATLAVTPVEGEPLDVTLLPDAMLHWADDGTVVLHASGGAVLASLEPAGAAAAAPPQATPAASPVAGDAGWRVADERELPVEARYVAMSPDGQWIAGSSPGSGFCVWDVETLTPACAGEDLPVRDETIAWAPDSSAVAFGLDAFVNFFDSDIHVYELDTGELTNLTDDGVDGTVLDAVDAGAPIDDVPVWSPDGQRIAFARSYQVAGDEPGFTSIMLIDRAGGEPVELLPLDVDEPYAVWMPMRWMPDGTLVYSQIVRDIEDPHNGLWKVGVDDGSSPLQIVPGSEAADIPGPKISGVAGNRVLAHSYWLISRLDFDPERPVFWLIDVATGDRAPLTVPDGESWIIDAGVSPDGATALLVTSSKAGERQLMLLDVASGEMVALDWVPRDTFISAGAPQWATNGTVLLQTTDGPLLLTLEPAA